MPTKILKPIRERPENWDQIEQAILRLLKTEIYLPLLKELNLKPRHLTLQNSIEDLISALQSGQIYFYRGQFKGQLTGTLTRELRKLGAKWDKKQGSFAIPLSQLPYEVRATISVSEAKFDRTLEKIADRLKEVVPEKVAEKLNVEKIFDKTIFQTEKAFQDSVRNITIAPELTPEQRQRIAEEYTKNLQLYVKDFTEEETLKLRQKVLAHAGQGFRYEGLVKEIQASFDVTQNKAKFLARQETSLLMTKFKQTRYESAGVDEYIWTCVAGSAKHPVRPMHKQHDGKKFRWDSPPIVDDKGNHKNPGTDYNCRCYARPVVKF